MENKIKLLLLSGGSLVGRNILDSLSQRRSFFEIIAFNSLAKEPSLFEYDKVYLCPPLVGKPQEFKEFFEEVIRDEKPDLVIPCRDEDVAFLSKFKQEEPSFSSHLLCGPDSIAHCFLDKWSSWEFSQTLGLPFAPTLNSDASPQIMNAFLEAEGFPLIAKPRKGFGSLGVFLITRDTQLKQVLERDDYVIQKYLGDPERVSNYLTQLADSGIPLFHTFEETKISVQSSIGPDGELGGMIITEHVMKQGISARVDLCEDEKVHQLAKNWVDKIAGAGWVGPINIQCQRDPFGQLMIYEFNGRFTGATSARFWLGFDEVGLALKLWLGVNLPGGSIEGLHRSVIRIPGSKPINTAYVEELNDLRVWNHPSAVQVI